MAAAFNCQVKTIELLVDSGANIDARSRVIFLFSATVMIEFLIYIFAYRMARQRSQ